MTGAKTLDNKTAFAIAFVVCALLLLVPATARAQWATGTNGNDIRSTNTGNVGVGTTTPPSKLTVSVTSNADGVTVDGTTNPMFSLKTSGIAKGYLGAATTTSAYAVGTSPGDIILRSQGGKLFFDTNSGVGTPALTIAGLNGGVGIGTTTPANGLHVHSATLPQAIRVSGSGGGLMSFMDTSAGANRKLYQWRSEGGLFRMSLSNDSADSLVQQNLLVANASGNIGIGTAAPLQRLQVGGNNAVATTGPDAISLGATYSSVAGANPKLRLFDDNTNSGVYGLGVSANQFDFMAPTGTRYVWNVNGAEKMRLDESGNVTVAGNISAKYQDVAEWVPSTQKLSAGTVVVLDKSETNHVLASTKAYDTAVAGVVSDSPGVILGVGGENKLKVATTGRVKVKVDATRAPIRVGDLLVTSEVEGVAMRSVEVNLGGVKLHRPGTIIGKALEPLASGTDEILVLLSLQ